MDDVGSEVGVVDGDVTKGDVMGTVDGGVVGGTVVEAALGIETIVEPIVVGGCVVGAEASVEGIDMGSCVEGLVVEGCVTIVVFMGSCVEGMVVEGCVVDMGSCVEGLVVEGCVTIVVFTLDTVVVRTVVGVIVDTVLVMGDADVYVVELVVDIVLRGLREVAIGADVGSPGLTPPTDSTVTTPITSSTTVKSGNSVVEDFASTPADGSLVYVVASTSLGVTKVTLSGMAEVTCIFGSVVTVSKSGMSVDTFAEADISLKSGF